MEKRAIEKFSIQARRDLIDGVDLQLRLLGIDDQRANEARPESTTQAEFYADMALPLVGEQITWRRQLVQEIQKKAAESDWQTARKDLIEEVAYTWFNRIIAIRFMEVNDYLPTGIRVLSSENGSNEPEIMTHTRELGWQFSETEQHIIDVADRSLLPEDMDRKYRMLFLKQVSELRQSLPNLFEHTDNFMKLLFTPSYNKGVIKDLITQIPEADFDVQQGGQVEIIGWLYQYYNTEPKNRAFKNKTYKTSDIPAVTQLFTPDWVVKYLVQNSLGRYWIKILQAKGNTNNQATIAKNYGWNYYMPDSPQKDVVINKIGHDEASLETKSVTDITFIDPAMGSGHILVYAFELFMQMYETEGYSNRESAKLILQNNLFGLDIDTRAFQLSYFALMMRARASDNRILLSGAQPRVFDIPESKFGLETVNDFLVHASNKKMWETLFKAFSNGNDLGSVISLRGKISDWQALKNDIKKLTRTAQMNLLGLNNFEGEQQLQLLVEVGELLSSEYDISVTNPPYMATGKMPAVLAKYVKKNYPNSKSDLFAVFMERLHELTKHDGFYALITQHQWMFLSSFENLRAIIKHNPLINMAHLGTRAFEEIGGEVVQSTAFVFENCQMPDFIGNYERLVDFDSQQKKEDAYLAAIANPSLSYVYRTNQANFNKIPGSPITYWFSNTVYNIYTNSKPLGKLTIPRTGLQTSDTRRFLRMWTEVSLNKIGKKWIDYAKGGSYRKWFGNQEYVVNWANGGQEIKKYVSDAYPYLHGNYSLVVKNEEFYFREGVLTSKITSSKLSFRYSPATQIFSDATTAIFPERNLKYLLGLSNSKVMNIVEELNPTINFQAGDFIKLPVIIDNESAIDMMVEKMIQISKIDWNSFEISWGFAKHPLLSNIAEHNRNWTVEEAFNTWSDEAETRFENLKSNEEELNRIFIDLYGLQDELTPEVADKDVSIRRADKGRDIKAFLSYFIGVVFGRYSLDVPGLAFAGGDWDSDKYTSFHPNEDDVMLLTDADYFGDDRDIINRLKEFLTTTFGADHLSQNLAFIANALGKKGDSAEKQIRSYFINDFYKQDHLSIYQKRPIYWQLDSGKRAGFRALFYLHRYDENTMAKIRTKYLHPLQAAYQSRREQLQNMLKTEVVLKSKNQLVKRIEQLTKQLEELTKYDVVLQHVANQHIVLDLDAGVLVNHEKVQGGEKVLTPIK